jgi:hypothetical protein
MNRIDEPNNMTTPVTKDIIEKIPSTIKGQPCVLVRPVRLNDGDKQRMLDMLTLHSLINKLWRVYWISSDAKVINKYFSDAIITSFRYMGYITKTNPVLHNTKAIWKELINKLPIDQLKRLNKYSPKMTKEQRISSSVLFIKIMELYNKNTCNNND